jgi:hypothetical protein
MRSAAGWLLWSNWLAGPFHTSRGWLIARCGDILRSRHVADILAGGSSGVKGTRQKGKTELCTSFGWVGFMLDLAWLRADGGLVSNEDQRDKAVTGKESFERGCHQECRIEGAVKSRG